MHGHGGFSESISGESELSTMVIMAWAWANFASFRAKDSIRVPGWQKLLVTN